MLIGSSMLLISKLIVSGKKKKKDLIESDEVNGYAFQTSFGKLNKSKKLDGFFSLFWDKIRGIK